jgi:hypothetical protein
LVWLVILLSSGIESLAEAWSNPEQRGETYYRQMTGSLVPTFFAKAAQAIDPYQRHQEGLGASVGVPDAMAYRIPFLSGQLAQRSTAFGEPAERWGVATTDSTLGKIGSGIQSMTMSIPVSLEREGADVEREFNRLRGFDKMPPSMPKRTKRMPSLRGAGGQSVKLNKNEYAVYDRWHQKAKAHLAQIIKSPNYARMPDGLKASVLRKTYDKYRRAANKEVTMLVRRRTTVGD